MSEDLLRAGDELAARLREVRDEFGPDEEDSITTDLGWISVDTALSSWKRAKALQAARETERS